MSNIGRTPWHTTSLASAEKSTGSSHDSWSSNGRIPVPSGLIALAHPPSFDSAPVKTIIPGSPLSGADAGSTFAEPHPARTRQTGKTASATRMSGSFPGGPRQNLSRRVSAEALIRSPARKLGRRLARPPRACNLRAPTYCEIGHAQLRVGFADAPISPRDASVPHSLVMSLRVAPQARGDPPVVSLRVECSRRRLARFA
jgi:hypothetical protein